MRAASVSAREEQTPAAAWRCPCARLLFALLNLEQAKVTGRSAPPEPLIMVIVVSLLVGVAARRLVAFWSASGMLSSGAWWFVQPAAALAGLSPCRRMSPFRALSGR